MEKRERVIGKIREKEKREIMTIGHDRDEIIIY